MSARVAVALVLAIALSISVMSALAVPTRSVSHSSFNADAFGTKLLYRLLEETSTPVERWRSPLDELDEEDGVLLMVGPFARRLRAYEAEAILSWVERGNALVLASTHGTPWSERGGASNEWELLERLGFDDPGRLEDWERAMIVTSAQIEVSKRIAPAMPSRLVDARGVLSGGSLVRTEPPQGPWAPLLRRGSRPHSWVRRLGEGRVAVMLEPGLVENRLLGEGDNARSVLRLLETYRGEGPVRFEETVHGHLHRPDVPWTDTTLRRVLVAQLALLALVYVLGRAPRLGGPRGGAPRRSRSTVELAESMATLYGLARVRRDAALALWHHARRAAARDPGAGDRLAEVEPELRRIVEARRVRDRDLLALDATIEDALAGEERERT